MSLNRLYQQMILEHNKNPRNFKLLENPTHIAHGKNPLCGDDFLLYLRVVDDRIEDIGFQGSGCAISKSSASLLTTMTIGKSLDDAKGLLENFLSLITDQNCSEETKEKVGRLKVFEGVKAFPVRVKCAALIWRTLESALENETHSKIAEVSTE